MLHISNIEQYRQHVQHKPEIREALIDHNSVCFHYMIADDNTFDDQWSREARGITFSNETGLVAGRPLHKFFNVNEKDSTRVENLDWSRVMRVMNKLDGSLVHTVDIDGPYGTIALKSKKVFTSHISEMATEFVNAEENIAHKKFCEFIISIGKTAIFEFTSPKARIVLKYDKPALSLLHVRDNVTGEYANMADLVNWSLKFGIALVEEVYCFWDDQGEFDIHAMLDAADTKTDIEGWIVQFENGDMVKVKTKWYLERHRIFTALRERDVVEWILNETVDDMKSYLVGLGIDISEILEIEELVVCSLLALQDEVEHIVSQNSDLSRKDFAIMFKEHHLFGLIMSKYLGKEVDYKDYFRRKQLRFYSLDVLNISEAL